MQVRDELEHLLDDDNDMAEMYLTQKLVDRGSPRDVSLVEEDDQRSKLISINISFLNSPSCQKKIKYYTTFNSKHDKHHLTQNWFLACRAEDSYSEHSDISTTVKPDVEELEMLIEAYFAQIDGTLQKLSDVSILRTFLSLSL